MAEAWVSQRKSWSSRYLKRVLDGKSRFHQQIWIVGVNRSDSKLLTQRPRGPKDFLAGAQRQICVRISVRDVVKGVRSLRELKLFEVSIVVAPMNELAVVTAVKAEDGDMAEQVQLFRQVLTQCRKDFGV
jgi:hypothetical protein